MPDDALVGHTGFVGSNLAVQRPFAARFNRANIADSHGRSFRRVVVSAAPATMWWANANPAADRANILALVDDLSRMRAEEVVLVSTIAVFDDAGAGHTEASERFELNKAYGRNRRELECLVAALPTRCHVVRLPALFGPGLKKNFVFDLLHPVPSFIRPDRFAPMAQATGAGALLDRYYAFDDELGMWELDRAGLDRSGDGPALTAALERPGLTALSFTNSASRFQFYDVGRLADDVDTAVDAGLDVLNICSEPLSAAQVAQDLTGISFDNCDPPVVIEDCRSVHAARFGGTGPYLYDRAVTLAALRRFKAGAGAG